MGRTMKKNTNSMSRSLIQAIVIAVTMGILSALVSTYLDVQQLKSKVEWLFKYQFPSGDK